MVRTCPGCGIEASCESQCPLCLAEGLDAGFYCSQMCFAKNWLAHRDADHKGGIAREKKRDGETDAQSTKEERRAKKSRKEQAQAAPTGPALRAPLFDGAWGAVAATGAPIEPPLSAKAVVRTLGELPPRSVVKIAAGASGASSSTLAPLTTPTECAARTMWTAIAAIAQLVAAASPALAGPNGGRITVVAGSAASAHALAWGLRCAKCPVPVDMALCTTDDAAAVPPSVRPHASALRVVTMAFMSVVAGRRTPPLVADWFDHGLVITLPDVPEPDAFQTLSARAVFLVAEEYLAAPAECPSPKQPRGSKGSKRDRKTSDALCDLEPTHTLQALALNAVPCPHTVFPVPRPDADQDAATQDAAANETDEATAHNRRVAVHRRYALCGQHDDHLTHLIVSDSLLDMIAYVQVLAASKGAKAFEELLVNALLCDRGGDNARTQHKLAMLLVLHCANAIAADASVRKHKADVIRPGTQQCGAQAVDSETAFILSLAKAVSRAAGTFALAPAATLKAKPLSLQATLCFLHECGVPEVFLDTLAVAWGLDEFILGYSELEHINAHRRDVVQRLLLHYGTVGAAGDGAAGPVMGPGGAKLLVFVYHLACAVCQRFTLTVADLAAATQWDLFFSYHFGPLETFVAMAGLTAGNDAAKGKGASLLSRTSDKSGATASIAAVAKALTPQTFLKPAAHQQSLPMVRVPVHERQLRQDTAMARAACDEILSAMPRDPLPMYVGDVGQLIGAWPKFNVRFGGRLGLKLMDFLMSRPEYFTVVNNLVTRRTAGTADAIRVRFDNEISDDDSEDGGGKKRITSSGGRVKHRKARRRDALKAMNSGRFNKNHQKFDPSAKVPGYIKHGPKAIKGRGKKPNVRSWKRSAPS